MKQNIEKVVLKGCFFWFFLALHYLWPSAEGRMRLNHENKILRLLFCIVFGFHYLFHSVAKVLTLGNAQINLAFRSLSRTFELRSKVGSGSEKLK